MNPQSQSPTLYTSSDITKVNNPSQKLKVSPFLALKKLKQTQANVQTVKKRYQVMQAQQNKIKNRSLYLEKQLMRIDEVRQNRSKDKQKWIQAIQDRKNQVKKQKDKNFTNKSVHQVKVAELRQSIAKQHKNQRDNIKKAQKQHEQKIIQMKKIDFGQKRFRRDKVVQQQQKVRINVDKFNETKLCRFLNQKTSDADQILKKVYLKQLQLKNLSEHEQQLIKRREYSINISQSMKQKLKRVLITDKTNRAHRFPNIKSRLLSNKETLEEKKQEE